jgi:hypothetical protein
MALTLTEKAALAALGIDEVMLKGRGVAARTIKAIGRAAVKVSPYVARSAVPVAGTAAGVAGQLAAANPISTGVGLGAITLASPQGQALLEMAAERGAADRRALEQAVDERIFQVTRAVESPQFKAGARSVARRKVSKYQKAVKASMKAVKQSKFDGKKGTIRNAKKTFGTVNRVVSAVKKGKKVSSKGVTGTIARAARRIFK